MADPEFIYNPDDWEITIAWEDRDEVLDDILAFRGADDVLRYRTLNHGPDKFAAHVPISWDENGDPDEREWQWFDSEGAAQERLKASPTSTT